MSVIMLNAPDVRPERLDHAAEAVVTITVQITLAGDELPAAATRLINDLEALVGRDSTGTGTGAVTGRGDGPAAAHHGAAIQRATEAQTTTAAAAARAQRPRRPHGADRAPP